MYVNKFTGSKNLYIGWLMGHKQVWRAQNMTEEKREILIYFFNMYII